MTAAGNQHGKWGPAGLEETSEQRERDTPYERESESESGAEGIGMTIHGTAMVGGAALWEVPVGPWDVGEVCRG